MKKHMYRFFIALVVGGLFAGCEGLLPGEEDDEEEVPTNIITSSNNQVTTPTVWETGSLKVIDCILYVNAPLTIEPGCILQFTEKGGMEIGFEQSAALIANGTPDKPILFTTTPTAMGQAGAWYGLRFGSNNVIAATVLSNCIFEGAGKNAQPVIDVVNTKLAMDSCIVRNGAGMGIRLSGETSGFTRFEYNTLSNCSDYLLHGSIQSLLGIDPSNVFTTTVNKAIGLTGGYMTSTGTLKCLSAPYTVLGTIRVDNAELTIEPGCTLKFSNETSLEIGGSQHAALIAEGTSEQSIHFTSASASPQPGDWNGICFFRNNSSNRSILKHVELSYGGRANGTFEAVIEANSGFKMIHCTIRDCKNFGVIFDEYSGFTECTGNNVYDCEKDPIFISASYTHTIGAENIIEAAPGMGIHVSGGTIDKNVTWLKQTMPYIIEGNIYVETSTGTASLTLSPGCDLRFMAGGCLEINHNAKLVAIGTEQDSIYFTSNAQTKSPGDWGNIVFWHEARALCELQYCRVDYGGDYHDYGIGIYTNNVKITHCAINHTEGCAIYIGYDEPPLTPILEENTFYGNDGPDVIQEH